LIGATGGFPLIPDRENVFVLKIDFLGELGTVNTNFEINLVIV